ncbi:uncharacterized protein LOC112051008 isoform X6 [Bicyclus anynana]|uniref:Uncharacterized protein LOC112051008 isoform X6 n=1 Tax=Bicyclus anynana TaxID=110368 RepID=A0ABM3M5L4_BICAN|nr:uncharacterized protein LOC112051008 isoform X6 [Bicyclus anynana]
MPPQPMYSNREYYEMMRMQILNETIEAARRMYISESLRRLKVQGIPNPRVPSCQTMRETAQLLLQHGRFNSAQAQDFAKQQTDYSNSEYYEMMRVQILNKTAPAARRMYISESVTRLKAEGITNPSVPNTKTIIATTQRLLDYGQFRTPIHARASGGSRTITVRLEDKIIEFFEKHPTSSTREMGRRFGLNNVTVRALLKSAGLYSRKLQQPLVFNDRRQETSPEGEPSTSTRYQTSRFVVEDEAENEEEEVEQIIIKEEVSEEEKNQCRLCLSVNRRMWELGENAPLYRKLLFETNQNSTMPSFIYEMLACWECHAELRKIRRFQDKVRRANSAFETSQNLNCQELSNLGTVLITEEQPSNSELQEDMIKQEPLDIEETAVPDPLDVNRAPKEEIIIEVPRRKFTPKTTKRTSTTKTSQNTPKRTKIDPNTQEDPQTDAPVDCDEIFCKVKIELEELQSILEGRRNKDSFKNMKYKCDSCVLGFTDYSRLQEHNASFHDEETGICSCDICERRFTDERLLATHTRNHFVKFVCRLCPFECYTKTGRMIHFRRHKEAVQSDDPDSVLRQKLSSMESTGESSHDLD